MDRDRFERLWSRCARASCSVPGLFEEIAAHYREPHRHYHTPGHVDHCLAQLDAARAEMRDPDSVELAVWYHDVIYDVERKDNEALSADLFDRRATGVMAPERIRAVHDLIMVTVHTRAAPGSLDQALMVDIDLSSFGLPWEGFLRDSVAVRKEYAHLSDEEFYPRQHDFLQGLLARDSFCFTEFFRRRHEHRARENIERYLDIVRSRGLI